MKNIKLITLAAMLVFAFAACGPDNGNGSGDGAWSRVSNSTFGSLAVNSVAWGNGVFVAAGGNGRIAFSADGISWTAAANSTFDANAIHSVAFGDGRFIAGGDGGRMAYSTDGVTWTAVVNSGFGNNEIYGIVRGADRWVAVGRNRMAHSADGISWTGMDSNDPFNFEQGSPPLQDAAWGNGKFVIVGPSGGQGHGVSLATSSDGINWENMGDVVLVPVYGICFGNGLFVAITLNTILHSSDAVAWTHTDSLGRHLHAVVYGDGQFIAVGNDDAILSSSDGISWTAFENVGLNTHLRDAVYGNGTWVVVGLNGVIAYHN